MTYRYKGKHVRINPDNSSALGICDYTGFVHNRVDLVRQMEWRGNALVWTGFLVGKDYVDVPNEQNRPPILPPDPIPVIQSRPQQPTFLTYSNNYNIPMSQLDIRYCELSGEEDGIPVLSEVERLKLLQEGGVPGSPSLSPAGIPGPAYLTPNQRLQQLQSFNWNEQVLNFNF